MLDPAEGADSVPRNGQLMARRWFRALGGKRDDEAPPLGWLDDHHGLLAELGRGATGVVYKACNRQGETYALKVPLLSAPLSTEARFITAMDSPHIARCLGMQGANLKLELLEGETLAQRLARRGRLTLPGLNLLVEGLLSGLEAVHALGVVHTDLKPSNIFVARQGRRDVVKLMDFGLALREGERRLSEPQGTAVYAAPEQWQDGPLERRVDLYALGVVLYEMATGLLPWSAGELAALLVMKRSPLPPISRFRGDLSSEQERLLSDLTRPQPEQRPATVEEVRERWSA